MKEEIKVVQLLDGREIIGKTRKEYHDLLGEVLWIKQPLAVMLQPQQNGDIGIKFIPPSFISVSDEQPFNLQLVLSVYSPNSEILDLYKKQTGSIVEASTLDLQTIDNLVEKGNKNG